MKQQIKSYETYRGNTPSIEFKKEAIVLQKKGWYVHTIAAFTPMANMNEIVVVYRKD